MRTHLLFAALCGCAAADFNTLCIKDLCVSEVAGRPDASADCSGYMYKTVTPDPVTETETIQVTMGVGSAYLTSAMRAEPTPPPTPLLEVRADQEIYRPVDVLDYLEWQKKEQEGEIFEAQGQKPIYAPGCGIYSYSSVCSCIGVDAKTTTLAAPTTTITQFIS